MSEDKMREEFENLVANYPYKRPVDRNGMGYVNDSVFLAYESWKACAAIKDAEIAELKTRLSGRTCFIPPEFQKQLDDAQAEIAARDLMIKESEEQMERAAIACAHGSSEIARDILLNALAKSEHHNSRALEKMLLKARIDELNCSGEGWDFHDRIAELEAKLAELNKE